MTNLNNIRNRKKTNSLKWKRALKKKPDFKEGLVPLDLADLDFPHPEELVEGLKTYTDEMIFGYTAVSEDYYKSVIDWFERRHKWTVKEEEIILSPGVVPAIYNSIKVFTEKNDGIIIMDPVYHPFSIAIDNLGRKKVSTDLVLKDNIYTIDFDDFEQKAKDQSNKMLILCSPHNPVGRVWTLEELKKIDKITRENNILVVSDEIHFDLVRPEYSHTVYSNISEGAKNNSIICTAPSKSFNIASLQNSNIIIQNEELRESYRKYLEVDGQVVRTNPLGQKATEILYNESEYWLDDLNKLIDDNFKFIKKYINKNLNIISSVELQGTYLLWINFKDFELDQDKLNEVLIYEKDLFLDNGLKFGKNGQGYMRMNIAFPQHIIESAFKRLKKLETDISKK